VVPALSQQAKNLEVFFNDATGNSKFGQIKDLEAAIKRGNTDTNNITLNTFLANMDTKRIAVINTIFANKGITKFNQYFTAYKKLNYLVTRDWNTDMAALPAATSDFLSARGNIEGFNSTGMTGNYGDGRGFNIIGIGNDGGAFNNQRDAMRDVMVGEILMALELDTLTGADLDKARAAALALVIQLGEDTEELRAFRDDIRKEGIAWGNGELIENYKCEYPMLAQTAPQSGTRLAHVDAKFSPELISLRRASPAGRVSDASRALTNPAGAALTGRAPADITETANELSRGLPFGGAVPGANCRGVLRQPSVV
jgi:hypothetical protein